MKHKAGKPYLYGYPAIAAEYLFLSYIHYSGEI